MSADQKKSLKEGSLGLVENIQLIKPLASHFPTRPQEGCVRIQQGRTTGDLVKVCDRDLSGESRGNTLLRSVRPSHAWPTHVTKGKLLMRE